MSGPVKHNLCPQIQSEASGEDRTYATTIIQEHYNKNCEKSIKYFERKERKQMTSEDERNIYQVFHPFNIKYSMMLYNRQTAKCHVTKIYKKSIKEITVLSWCFRFHELYLIYTYSKKRKCRRKRNIFQAE